MKDMGKTPFARQSCHLLLGCLDALVSTLNACVLKCIMTQIQFSPDSTVTHMDWSWYKWIQRGPGYFISVLPITYLNWPIVGACPAWFPSWIYFQFHWRNSEAGLFQIIVVNWSHINCPCPILLPRPFFLSECKSYIKVIAPYRQSNEEPELKKKCQNYVSAMSPWLYQ